MPIDQGARDMAKDAIARISAHEDVCAQRWQSAMTTMGEIKRIMAWGIGGVISTMGGLIVWLATHPGVGHL